MGITKKRELPKIKFEAPTPTPEDITREAKIVEVFEEATDPLKKLTFKKPVEAAERVERATLNHWMLEWAVLHGGISPREYLNARGLSDTRVNSIMSKHPTAEWNSVRDEFTAKAQRMMVEKHSELIVDTSETHLKASNIGLAKAIEMLTKGVEMHDSKLGKNIRKPIRSVDLLNCMSAIEKAQAIYRKAVGLSDKDGEGLKEFVQTLASTGSVTNNTQINIVNGVPQPTTKVGEMVNDLSYDEILQFIEHKRDKLQLAERNAIADEQTEAAHDVQVGDSNGKFSSASASKADGPT